MTRPLYYLISAIFLTTIFSPLVQTAEEPEIIPLENIDLVDIRLRLVYQNPERADELGLAPAEEGKINLVAQVETLNANHHHFIQQLGGEITSSFPRFNTVCFVISIEKVPEVTYLPGLTWLEADVLFYPSLDNSIDSIGTDVIWNQFGFMGEDTTIAILDTGVDFNHESLDDLYKTIDHETYHHCFNENGETDGMDEHMEERVIYCLQCCIYFIKYF